MFCLHKAAQAAVRHSSELSQDVEPGISSKSCRSDHYNHLGTFGYLGLRAYSKTIKLLNSMSFSREGRKKLNIPQ